MNIFFTTPIMLRNEANRVFLYCFLKHFSKTYMKFVCSQSVLPEYSFCLTVLHFQARQRHKVCISLVSWPVALLCMYCHCPDVQKG